MGSPWRVVGVFLVVLLVVSPMFATSIVQGYHESGYHTTGERIRHGCPGDPGCVGNPAGDHNRVAYSRTTVTGDYMGAAWVLIRAASSHEIVDASSSCTSCRRIQVEYETGSAPECRFVTDHWVRGRLAWHSPMPMMETSRGIC